LDRDHRRPVSTLHRAFCKGSGVKIERCVHSAANTETRLERVSYVKSIMLGIHAIQTRFLPQMCWKSAKKDSALPRVVPNEAAASAAEV
jgi:hypothetical protein